MDRQTEIVKLTVVFRNFAEMAKELGCTEIIQIPSSFILVMPHAMKPGLISLLK